MWKKLIMTVVPIVVSILLESVFNKDVKKS